MSKISVIATNCCGWPNLTKLENGQVLCTYFNAPSHGLIEGDLVCSISDQNGSKWIKQSVVAQRPNGGNRMHLAVGQCHNGDLICVNSGFFIKDEKLLVFQVIGYQDPRIWERHGPPIVALRYPVKLKHRYLLVE
jgi:hypothetical protein